MSDMVVAGLEFPADLEAYSGDVRGVGAVRGDQVGTEQPCLVEVVLVAHPEGVLAALHAARRGVAARLHSAPFDNDLVLQVEQVLDAERPTPGIVRRVVELGKAGE